MLGVNTLKGYISDMKYVFTKEGASSLGGFGTIGGLFPSVWDWRIFWERTAFLSIILAFMTKTGEEHLDLVCGGVLRLVEHYHGVVKGSSAHESQGGYLYHLGLHVLLELHGGDHILQGVVKRLEIGVDFVFHVAWEKTELLAGLDRRAREYDFFTSRFFSIRTAKAIAT